MSCPALRILFCFPISALALAGCSTPHLEFPPEVQPRSTYADGVVKLREKGANNVEVSVGTKSEPVLPGQPAVLIAGLGNFGTSTFTFGVGDIQILESGRPLEIFTPEEARLKFGNRVDVTRLLEPATVGPLDFITGEVWFKAPAAGKGKPLEVRVRAGGETFSFPLVLKP